MDLFAANLRKRAKELGISNAEAARRIGLSERRYAHYITGAREPDLASLVRIAEALRTTPDELLGVGTTKRPQTKKSLLRDRINLAIDSLGDRELEQTAVMVEAVAMAKR